MLIDFIVTILLLLLIGGAITYLWRAKKRGQTCVGCPHAKQCAMHKQKSGCECSCGGCGSTAHHAHNPAERDKSQSESS